MPWDLTGNSGTNPATDFLGTTDNQPLVIKTNGVEALRIDGNGSAGIRGSLSVTESGGQGSSTLLFLRQEGGHFPPNQPNQNVSFILDPANRVFNLDVGGQNNSQARIHLGDPFGPDNQVTTLGNVGIGTTNPQERLEVSGNILVRGDFFRMPDIRGRQVFNFDSTRAVLDLGATDNAGDLRIAGDDGRFTILLDGHEGDIRLMGADCAEDFDVSEVEAAEPGTVMVIDQAGTLKPSEQPYDKRVAGVISGAEGFKSGIIFDKQQSEAERMPVALMGKVGCKVDAQHSPIEVGDLLTTSPTPGHAMKAVDHTRAFGATIGKALRPLRAGNGIIPTLIALQ